MTDKTRNVVGPLERAKFDVIFQSKLIGPTKLSLRYIINEIHMFELAVLCDVEPVALQPNKTLIKINSQEENQSM